MANRIGNKIWKEKSRRGMSRKRFWTKKLFYKAGKRNICRRNRIALHVQHASITALVFYSTLILVEQRNIYAIFQIKLQEKVFQHDWCFWMLLSICPYLMAGGLTLIWSVLAFFYRCRIFMASPQAKLKVAQPTPHFMVKLSCKTKDPYL